MNLNLAKSRKELVQLLVLAVIGALTLTFVIVNLVVSQRARHRRNAIEAAKIMEALNKADREVHAMMLSGDEYRRLQAAISVAVSNDIVQPVLGSYLLSVRDRFEQIARRAGVKLTGIHEIGLQALPRAGGAPKRTFQSYAIQATGAAGYAQLIIFLKEIETSNPYLNITDLSIAGRDNDPRTHSLSVRVEWPVMASEGIPLLTGGAK